jgi:DNA polymerase-1
MFPDPPGGEGGETAYRLITDASEALTTLTAIADKGELVGLDLETTGLDPLTAKARLVQIAAPGVPVVVIDLFQTGRLEALREPLSRLRAVAHNAVFEMSFLHRAGIHTVLDCTMLMAHALQPGEGGSGESLEALALRYLGITLDKGLQTSDWSGELSPAQLRYAALDAAITLRLHKGLRALLEREKATRVYELMRDAQPSIVVMQLAGMPFDTAAQAALIRHLKEQRAELQPQLGEALAGRNPGSGQQIGEWLAWCLGDKAAAWPKTGKGKLSTAADDLKRGAALLAPEKARVVRELLLPFKVVSKHLSTYGETLAHYVSADADRIHASFHLAGTVTGRMSSSKPNLQNIPRDRVFRELFKAPDGRLMVVADYSQIELRVAVILAKEQRMLEAFDQGQDVHSLTAARLLRKSVEDVTKQERQLAKAVNFGLLYGQGVTGLQLYASATFGVEITLEEAGRYRDAWFDAYPAFRRWHGRVDREGKRDLLVRSPSGRVRRWLSREYKAVGGFKLTEASNTPVQGGAAEVMLATLGHLPGLLARVGGLDAVPVAVVHDEIVLEAAEAHAPAAGKVLETAMILGMADIFPGATTTGLVEVSYGRSWADKS